MLIVSAADFIVNSLSALDGPGSPEVCLLGSFKMPNKSSAEKKELLKPKKRTSWYVN